MPTLSLPPALQRYDRKRGPFYQFWMGMRFFCSGWKLLLQSARLQLISVIPILLTAGLLVGLTLLSSRLTGYWLSLIPANLPTWVSEGLEAFSSLLVLILVLLFLFFPLVTLLSAPLRELLATQTEELLTGSISAPAEVGLGTAILELVKLILMQVGLLILSVGLGWFVPVLGQGMTLLILVYLAGLDMVDPLLGRRGYLLKPKLHFIATHRALMGGFGLMVFVLLTIPVLNLLILPVASIGGTALVLSVLDQFKQAQTAPEPKSTAAEGKT